MGWCPCCESELILERNGRTRRHWRIDGDAVVIVCYTEVEELELECCPTCSFKEAIDFQTDRLRKYFNPPLYLN